MPSIWDIQGCRFLITQGRADKTQSLGAAVSRGGWNWPSEWCQNVYFEKLIRIRDRRVVSSRNDEGPLILDAFLKFNSSHYDIRENSWEIRSSSDVSSKTYANSSTSRRYHEYWMRNTDLGMFFYCAQLATRQFSRYMRTTTIELLTDSWRMRIHALWFKNTFQACDLLQCLILVITFSAEFWLNICAWAGASGIYCQANHFSNFHTLVHLLFSSSWQSIVFTSTATFQNTNTSHKFIEWIQK